MKRPTTCTTLLVLALAAGCGPKAPKGPLALTPAYPATQPAAAATAAAPTREPWRAQQPVAAALRPFQPPKISKLTLSNGIPVYVAENHTLPLAVVSVLVRGGSSANPADKPGLASLTANLLDEGAGKRKTLELAGRKDELGATLATAASSDISTAYVDALVENLDPSLELLADVVLKPSFDPKEFERVRAEVATDLKRQRDSGPTIASNVLELAIYGKGHPYAYPDAGTEATIGQLTRADVVAFYRQNWNPANAAIIVAGDVTPDAIRQALERRFGGWKPSPDARKAPHVPAAPAPGPRRILLVDRPAAQQGDVAVGHAGPSRKTPDWLAVELVSRVLGGMFTSRINLNLRENKGYTYGARASFVPMVGPGELACGGGMVLDKTPLAVVEIMRELQDMLAKPPTAAELTRAKDAATLGLGARFESNASIAGAVGEIVVYDLPLDYFETYPAAVQAVSSVQVNEAARRYLAPDRATIVVVGPKDKLLPGLNAANLGPIEERDPTGEPPAH